jgi:hypothetical protein
MLRVTIEVIPNGDETKKRPIRVMTISNMTGLADVSDYEVHVVGERHTNTKRGLVRGHTRLKLGCWALIARAIKALKLDLEG